MDIERISNEVVDKPPETRGITHVHIYCKGHFGAGIGTWATVVNVPNSTVHKVFSGQTAETTANAMEVEAAIHGFEALTRPCLASVFSNNKYLLDGIKLLLSGTHYDSNLLKWVRLLDAMEAHTVSMTHIPKTENSGYMRLADSVALNLLPPEGRR